MTEKTEQGDYKTELRKKFEGFCEEAAIPPYENIFDFFTSEIEQREAIAKQYFDLWNPVDEYVRVLPSVLVGDSVSGKALELIKRTSHLEELLKAADLVIDAANTRNWLIYVEAIEAYNKLKNL